MLFLRVIAWYGAEKISLKKSCFYLYIRRHYVSYWAKTSACQRYGFHDKRTENASYSEAWIEFVGLDGLFTSVLTMLNMAELGFSSAVVYKLYKPIAEGKTEKVCALINYYKKIYRVIGAVVLGVGVLLIPFLPYIVSGELPNEVNLYRYADIFLMHVYQCWGMGNISFKGFDMYNIAEYNNYVCV